MPVAGLHERDSISPAEAFPQVIETSSIESNAIQPGAAAYVGAAGTLPARVLQLHVEFHDLSVRTEHLVKQSRNPVIISVIFDSEVIGLLRDTRTVALVLEPFDGVVDVG